MNAPHPQVIAVGVIATRDGFLIEQRSASQHLAGSWAFPGGKAHVGESPRGALRRELSEELTIQPGNTRWLLDIPWHYGEKHLWLRCYQVTDWRGQINAVERQALCCQPLSVQNRMAWLAHAPAANAGLINALLLPKIMRITPPATDPKHWMTAVLARAQRLRQPGLIQLRPERSLAVPIWQELVQRLTLAGHWALLNAGAQTIDLLEQIDPQSGRVGAHLKQHLLTSLPQPVQSRWQQAGGLISAAVHNANSLAQANQLPADMVTVSPVKATPSHPGQRGAGWPWFAAMAAQAAMPVYALGGVGPVDLPCVHRHRGFGVAGISACWEDE